MNQINTTNLIPESNTVSQPITLEQFLSALPQSPAVAEALKAWTTSTIPET